MKLFSFCDPLHTTPFGRSLSIFRQLIHLTIGQSRSYANYNHNFIATIIYWERGSLINLPVVKKLNEVLRSPIVNVYRFD